MLAMEVNLEPSAGQYHLHLYRAEGSRYDKHFCTTSLDLKYNMRSD
jgi:hypothetical protein